MYSRFVDGDGDDDVGIVPISPAFFPLTVVTSCPSPLNIIFGRSLFFFIALVVAATPNLLLSLPWKRHSLCCRHQLTSLKAISHLNRAKAISSAADEICRCDLPSALCGGDLIARREICRSPLTPRWPHTGTDETASVQGE
ncbi:hypothetical protein L484_004544 [Morus notabilis]|uniref:Uncharacterized protein n=1 Tax=Morus notabilis TaxID=981085 RepID=W9RV07_9ROSA|nr:hypothetical protein L484_004544 [Morus notabilis]